MEIVHDRAQLHRYMRDAVRVSGDNPVLIDRYLNDAIEVDVDCIADGSDGDAGVMIGGIMEHVEAAGIHRGSCTALPADRSTDADAEDTFEEKVVEEEKEEEDADEGIFTAAHASMCVGQMPRRSACRLHVTSLLTL
jgi:hypothetical protein